MSRCLLSDLERTYVKCSDGALDPEYAALLRQLDDMCLTQELVDFLCEKMTSKKHFWEIHFDHLRVLLRNPSAKAFDLKDFYLERIKKSRRLAMKIFLIRGYAIDASEAELIPIMQRFQQSLKKNHDYIDYNYILSVAGLPYLVNTYGYDCFADALVTAKQEHERIDPLLRGYFTLNENLEQVSLLSIEEVFRRSRLFTEKHKDHVD